MLLPVMRGTTELLKDIVSDLDDSIESGYHTQEEIVDMVTKGLESEGYAPDDVTTTMGAQAEALVEAAFLSYRFYSPSTQGVP